MHALRPFIYPILGIALASCGGSDDDEIAPVTPPSASKKAPLIGEYIDRITFTNPYAHIPAQCYIETSGGTQNACLFCHSNGLFKLGLGNNNPQAGYEPIIGNLQLEYAFVALNYPHLINGSVMPWQNTLQPDKLRAVLTAQGIDPTSWQMQAYIREDNWTAAYQQRPGTPLDWESGVESDWRLFPGLDPADLPADSDGFVRSSKAQNGHFHDGQGYQTGWRAVNFMPYGIFIPHSGSVSGIYLRLPTIFMQNGQGEFDLATYQANLDLVARAIQDRLRDEDKTYQGAAANIALRRGLYPLGTEIAHPLHYVDVAADGTHHAISPFPGTRSRRVKEIRYMYKYQSFEPDSVTPGNKNEDAAVYAHRQQGWIDNGAGWYLSGFIEAADGALRPQTPSELTQCVGCHSGNVYQAGAIHPPFNSGTGNTVDSTWSLPRQWRDGGWAEMDYFGYRAKSQVAADETPGNATRSGDPLNRGHGRGEFAFFLDHVVGASLYGDMPAAMESFFATNIQTGNGYSANWPALESDSAEGLLASQQLRQSLLREMTARGGYLDAQGRIHAELLYPPPAASLASAMGYRQVVVTQRYDFGKDMFPDTPFTLRYYRREQEAFAHQDGRPYQLGEVITDRPIDTTPASFTYGFGIGETLIDEALPFEQGGTYYDNYVPLLE
ncbi:hypothetical protein D5085_13285 [Ectothiorhodospiraceae bacterium BW-2]|nr:hypothetical protein D5085_13285 [Ectothiorhodospiraceae bacterium BW-2]